MEEEASSTMLKRTVKDSVFTDLFRQKRYLIQLYRSLHPEDAETDEGDITIVTIQNIITDGLYNDLGFMVKDRLVILVEAHKNLQGAGRTPRQDAEGRGGDSEDLPDDRRSGGVYEKP